MHNVKPKSTAHTEQRFSNITRINNQDNKHIIYSAVTKLGIKCTGTKPAPHPSRRTKPSQQSMIPYSIDSIHSHPPYLEAAS